MGNYFKVNSSTKPEIPKLPKELLEELEKRHYKFFCTEFNARIDQFVNASQVTNIAALRFNPFKKTIVELFCSDPESGAMTFRDFLDMCSVFSPKAPREAKIIVIFMIFTATSKDNLLRQSDIENVIGRLVGDNMKTTIDVKDKKEISSISGAAACVMKEADLDDSGEISYKEFQRLCMQFREFDNYVFTVV
ncbi:hypothetical protein C9374_002036 [Naegleria lovaniensis]|uniref:EF-hand domain-containing protein n=1 Tax=Naegleria lovaniensis TaxID=51637 RepID=A0AA88GRD1_NAELO|nr:uncharacterized protein C9374_002036 [Naegleria lovaniensis]KAG2387001.1 hypothetical protein C9374_002036 [Naegleria lovaniensis]